MLTVFNPFLQLLENYLYPRSRIKSGGMIIASDMNKLRRPEEANRTLNRIPRLSGHPHIYGHSYRIHNKHLKHKHPTELSTSN
ncbi:hypothetical protein PNOK_0921900 [Pyrrhoderma noxium]|uniref:Uncharacterized protein n=1 Tax=Pyrrhoderma noxium TaxID=2282107 RepID=A0A286U7A4_9AGAM|nr:hypothetical protein PNOK_0921900 [Pyrrhoderma noxium]